MVEKFKMTKIISKNVEQLVISLFKYSSEDTRIDIFRKFLRVGENGIRREVLDCYLTILKNLPISFYKLFEEDESTYLMNLDACFTMYKNKFPNFKLSIEAFDRIIRVAEIYDINNNNIMSGESNYEGVKDKFLLNNFYNKNVGLIEGMLNDFKQVLKTEVDALEIANLFMIANIEFEFNLIYVLDIFKLNFVVKDEKIDLQSFFDFFLKKYFFKIKVSDFLNISADRLINIYISLDKIITAIWNKADMLKNDVIYFKEFESVMKNLLGNAETKWKISEYFKYFLFFINFRTACGTNDKDFITKNEFFSFMFNEKDCINILLKLKGVNNK
jgi:hypothetical protein